jgi:hypothetical protein
MHGCNVASHSAVQNLFVGQCRHQVPTSDHMSCLHAMHATHQCTPAAGPCAECCICGTITITPIIHGNTPMALGQLSQKQQNSLRL